MNDQLFQQLLDSVTQMTEIIKKQQETIDKLTNKDVEYITVEKGSADEVQRRLNETHIVPYKTTGVNEQKDVATCFKQGFDNSGNIEIYPDLSNVSVGKISRKLPEPPPCRKITFPTFWDSLFK